MRTRYTISAIIVFLLFIALSQFIDRLPIYRDNTPVDNHQIFVAFNNKNSNVLVSGSGTVVKMLADDRKGRKHQRFIVELDKKLTVLIAHNIDIAPRIDNLANGDTILFKGEYEWNKQGGVVHWTHRDPAGKHTHGWVKHRNILYQ